MTRTLTLSGRSRKAWSLFSPTRIRSGEASRNIRIDKELQNEENISFAGRAVPESKAGFKPCKNDFKTKYAGSYLGIVWAFIQPIVTILVYWFVFSVGLKAGTVSDYPFVLYLVSGIVPWFFFQDALNGGTNALIEYNYLVKKVVFKISILPIVKIISALFVHVFFVAFALILCACYGYTPSLYTLQIIYYSVCTFLFVLGLVYATSAIVIFSVI